MSGEEEPLKMEVAEQPQELPQEQPQEQSNEATSGTVAAAPSENNFLVLDTAGDSEDSEKETGKEIKQTPQKDEAATAAGDPVASKEEPAAEAEADGDTAKPAATNANPRVRKKPKAPVVDVTSLRKRKWQLKVYPLHADDLQLSYVSILCKLASESLLYIPSESRHGKAELYVATQKETAAIIGKLLRMDFHHKLLSIEVVRKDTGGKEDGDESKKECKAFLMFDKYLTKKIFDAKGEKGTLIEKIVTLNKLPKAATKDFIGALFPFATEIEIIENDDPEERKATVKCKTPVTSLLVYKSFKRLEINDVHVKLSVDDSVKAIKLPPVFFTPPEKKEVGPPDSIEALNQSSLPRRRPPLLNPLNRRVAQIRKRALLTRKKPTRGQMMLGQRGMPLLEEPLDDRRGGRGLLPDPMMSRGLGGGPGRRRLGDRPMDRRNRDRDSPDRRGRRSGGREESQVTKEMLQLQNQLNQAIKNQIAMLNTAQSGNSSTSAMRNAMTASESYPMSGASHRTSLLGHGPRHFGNGSSLGPGPRGLDQHQPEFGGNSWTSERSRMDRGDRGDRERPDRSRDRERMHRGDRMDNSSSARRDRGDHLERPGRMETRPERHERGSRDRSERDRTSASGDMMRQQQRSQRQVQAFGGNISATDSSRVKADRGHNSSATLSASHGAEPTRGSSRSGRGGSEYASTARVSQRNDSSYTGNSHAQSSTTTRYSEYSSQVQGENGSYYRRY